jgi:hypothetical protein
VVAYPAPFGWVILAVGEFLLIWAAIKAGSIKAGAVGVGAAASVLALLAAAALLTGAQSLLAALGVSAMRDTLAAEAAGWVIVLAVLPVVGWLLFRRPEGFAGRWAGAIFAALVVAGLIQAFAPAAAPILAWPVVWACVSAAATSLNGGRPWLSALIAVPALALVSYMGHLAFLALLTPLAMAPWPWLALLVLAPLIRRPEPRVVKPT